MGERDFGEMPCMFCATRSKAFAFVSVVGNIAPATEHGSIGLQHVMSRSVADQIGVGSCLPKMARCMSAAQLTSWVPCEPCAGCGIGGANPS